MPWSVDLDGVPDWVQSAIDRVAPDFMRPTEVPLRFGMTEDGRLLAIEEAAGWSAFSIEHYEPGEAFVVTLADFLQEQVFDQCEATWGEARPLCPGHRHMLVADVRDGRAWWTCPVTNRPVVRIGEYVGRSRQMTGRPA